MLHLHRASALCVLALRACGRKKTSGGVAGGWDANLAHWKDARIGRLGAHLSAAGGFTMASRICVVLFLPVGWLRVKPGVGPAAGVAP